MSDPSFTVNPEHVPDELVTGGPVKTATKTLTDLGASGALVRGTVLGMISADGRYGLSLTAAGDGSEVPRAVLAKDADPSGGDVQALVYEMADANESHLTLGAGHTLASIREPLRAVGIFVKTPVPR